MVKVGLGFGLVLVLQQGAFDQSVCLTKCTAHLTKHAASCQLRKPNFNASPSHIASALLAAM